MATPHNSAEKGQIAKSVLLPGDPLRAKFIAENFLTDPVQFNSVRGIFGYTGTYNGKSVSVMATGMGCPSIGIYSYELIHFYDVENLIRIGSCGALQKDLELGDLIMAIGAVRDDGVSRAYADIRFPAVPDLDLLNACVSTAKKNGWRHRTGIVHSHESFYIDTNEEEEKNWSRMGVLGADMETAALFTVGRLRGIKTASILNNVVLYGRDTAEAVAGYAEGDLPAAEGEKREILCALEALAESVR
jgi:uridine phosphorylase